ncbi:hypothetical protein HK097_008632 [Rhizophlyctis rosea]|uniref:Uncharacterized protein n=1 Tax=Rhizophlyctis rosea TaxID=64517 RepID=A0AAD5SA32_9FUNG|nr:hypothetical protein HK097_008632 [Rhizophlyctis rosea]
MSTTTTTTIDPRYGDPEKSVDMKDVDESDAHLIIERQKADEEGNAIKYQSCSWQKTAALLFSEYICLAIMSFPWSYSVLGLIPGLILTIVVAGFVQYTSLVLCLCTIWFSLITAVISFVCSLPRTFSAYSKAALLSAVFTFVSVILAPIFAAIEDHPAGYPKFGEP